MSTESQESRVKSQESRKTLTPIQENWKTIDLYERKAQKQTGDPEAGFNPTLYFLDGVRKLILNLQYRGKKGKKGEETLSAEELSFSLGIDLQEIITATSQNAWVYYNSTAKPEIGIVIEINQENQIGAKQLIMSIENHKPGHNESGYYPKEAQK